MAKKPSEQDLYDEAAMQDAIEAKKATGGLVETNPQDAPQPVKQEISGYKRDFKLPKEFSEPRPTKEDQAFEALAAQQGNKPAVGEGKFTGNPRTNGSRQQGGGQER